MLGGLSCISFSDRYNAVYDSEIFHEMMIKAVIVSSNLASVVNAVRKSRMATSARNPQNADGRVVQAANEGRRS